MFGRVQAMPQDEDTPFYPRSPYGVAKLYAHWMTVNYRESLRHLRQQRHPVQPRVAAARPRVRHAQGHRRRRPHRARASTTRWSSAISTRNATGATPREYVDGMWRMLQHRRARHVRAGDRPDADGAPTSSSSPSRRPASRSHGAAAASTRPGVDAASGKVRVRINPAFYRPAEVDRLLGNPAKARRAARLVRDDAARGVVPR